MPKTAIMNQPDCIRSLLLLLLTLPFSMCTSDQSPAIAPGTFHLKAMIDLQFDVVRFKVKPGSNVTLTLTNVSDMSHNLLITKPGSRLHVVDTALKLAEKGPQMDYIPAIDDVLWSIPVVSPGQTKSVSFTAPAQTGVYPYVCTYPGHGYVMYGAMYVTTDENLPEIKNDLNIPESRRHDDSTGSKEITQADHSTPASPHP